MNQAGSRKSSPDFPSAQHQQTPVSKRIPGVSLAAARSGGKFIAHLLGLDHEHPLTASTPEKHSAVSSSLSSIKLSDALQGIKLTPNFMFFLLFLGFFLWLFVIYWIRHNEPLANQVLGTPKANYDSALVDRQVVAGIKKTFPVRTSASTGEVYVPGGVHAPAPESAIIPQAARSAPTYPVQYPSSIISGAPAMPAQGYPDSYIPPMSTPQQATAPTGVMTPAVAVGGGNYMVGIQTNSGTRVKTIVSR